MWDDLFGIVIYVVTITRLGYSVCSSRLDDFWPDMLSHSKT